MNRGLLKWIKKLYWIASLKYLIPPRKIGIALGIIFLLSIPIEMDADLDLELDLEENVSPFVLESKKIEIPSYPYAYNPSIIRWNGKLLLSFRITYNEKSPFDSEIGLIWLDDDFNLISDPFILDTKGTLPINSRAEDGRLVQVGEKLYLIYSNNTEKKVSKGGFRVYIGEVICHENSFDLINKECLSDFDGESKELREKNWVPFDYNGNLMLAYSLDPHVIFLPLIGTGSCITQATSKGDIKWNWGHLRGGTPALNIDGSEYLAFFHTSKPILSTHSEGKTILHYFMGAYTFSAAPPFSITKVSPVPIVGKGFYSGTPYTSYYWKKIQRVVFPTGYIYDTNSIWVAYGREDHEIWISKLDREGLMKSLIPVETIINKQL